MKLLEGEPSGSFLNFPFDLLDLLVITVSALCSYLANIFKYTIEFFFSKFKAKHEALIDKVMSEHKLTTKKLLKKSMSLLIRIKLLIGFFN